MHGGSAETGAPHANQNALRAGLHTRAVIAEREAVRLLLMHAHELLAELE